MRGYNFDARKRCTGHSIADADLSGGDTQLSFELHDSLLLHLVLLLLHLVLLLLRLLLQGREQVFQWLASRPRNIQRVADELQVILSLLEGIAALLQFGGMLDFHLGLLQVEFLKRQLRLVMLGPLCVKLASASLEILERRRRIA
jgi:hypothetical protein